MSDNDISHHLTLLKHETALDYLMTKTGRGLLVLDSEGNTSRMITAAETSTFWDSTHTLAAC